MSLGCNRSPLSVANRVARRSYGWRQFRKGRLPAITGAPTPTEAASVATSGGVGQTLQLRSAPTCEPYFHRVTLDVNDMSALRMLNMSTLASTQRRVVTLTALIGSCDRGFKVELQNFGRTTCGLLGSVSFLIEADASLRRASSAHALRGQNSYPPESPATVRGGLVLIQASSSAFVLITTPWIEACAPMTKLSDQSPRVVFALSPAPTRSVISSSAMTTPSILFSSVRYGVIRSL